MSHNHRLAHEYTQTDFHIMMENGRLNQTPPGGAAANLNQQDQIAALTQRLNDLQQQNAAIQQQFQQLAQQNQNVVVDGPAAVPAARQLKAPYTGKPPVFCLQNDKASFKIWMEK
jgi:hypothetical protein